MPGTEPVLTCLGIFFQARNLTGRDPLNGQPGNAEVYNTTACGANYATASYKGFTQFSKTVGGFEVHPSRALSENLRCNQLSRTHTRTP